MVPIGEVDSIIYKSSSFRNGIIFLVAASTSEPSVKDKKNGNLEASAKVGKLIAERAIEKGIQDVAFDRSGYKYHGRVKALAEAAREAGLLF